MNFFDYKVQKVWFDAEKIYIETTTGQTTAALLSSYPALQKASEIERHKYTIIGDGHALCWEALDEDLSIAGFFEKQ
jgi:Protein of unknown function (DUF2442)